MLTANRLTWFIVSLCFGLPIMALMLSPDEGHDRGSLTSAALFAVAMATIVTICFSRGKR
ncbi:hypothetical protein GCM10022223_42600 [Kineosporia mesophila]|uniref:Uncharacterized protein n=1 Tax=Kineosporia mesophila TaxID=566012 RepID=A0ABP6ZZG7_9ACTN|nr:hypothetical protein [Kineosporia mesophila]MCD5353298.1 hypothetical protein [Kineosporia mesophila]